MFSQEVIKPLPDLPDKIYLAPIFSSTVRHYEGISPDTTVLGLPESAYLSLFMMTTAFEVIGLWKQITTCRVFPVVAMLSVLEGRDLKFQEKGV